MNGQPFWFVPNYCQITDDGQKRVSFWRLKCTKVILNRVDFFLSRLFVSTLCPALLLLFTTTTVTKLGKTRSRWETVRLLRALITTNWISQWQREKGQASEWERERENVWEWKSERARETKSATLTNLALSPSLSLHFLFLKMFPYFNPFSPSLFLSLGNSFYCSVSLQQSFYYILVIV